MTAQVERLDAPPNEERFRTVVFEAVPNQPGEYVATVPNDRVGRYALKVESGEDTASLDYRVTLPPEHELAPGPMNEAGPAQAGRADRRQVLPRGRPAPLAGRGAAAEGDVHAAEGDAAVDVLAGAGRWWSGCSRWNGWCGSSAI